MTGLRWSNPTIMLASALLVSSALAADYGVDIDLWLEGEPVDVSVTELSSRTPVVVDVPQKYRLSLIVESMDDSWAPANAIWLRVDVFQWSEVDEAWVFVTDALSGAPLGQAQTVSLTAPGVKAGPNTSDLYLVASVTGVTP